MRRVGLMLAISAACLSIFAGLALAGGGIVNSGFEQNSFNGWQTAQEGDAGDFVVYKGSPLVTDFLETRGRSKRGGVPRLSKPVRGKYATASVQGGPGTQLLFRNLALPSKTKRTISFWLYYDNQAGVFANPTPDSLHAGQLAGRTYGSRGDEPPEGANQQYRVDILRKGAKRYSIKDSDVLKSLLASETGDPAQSDWKRYSFKLDSLPAGPVKLRVAQADNVGPLIVGFDDLRLETTGR